MHGDLARGELYWDIHFADSNPWMNCTVQKVFGYCGYAQEVGLSQECREGVRTISQIYFAGLF
jgi:hypothetical protein